MSTPGQIADAKQGKYKHDVGIGPTPPAPGRLPAAAYGQDDAI